MRTSPLRTLALATALGLTAMVADAGPASAAPHTGLDELHLVARINAERAAAGLAPLAVDGALFDSARAWSGSQAGTGTLAHDTGWLHGAWPAGTVSVGENVGASGSADEVHAALMNSASHRANILNPSFTTVGVGEVVAADGRVFVTQRFTRVTTSAQTASTAKAAKPKAKAKAKARPKARRARR